jgi:bifunctional UDP-N-acetylglucosamine pyrophosphorylase / glucosamine-1-phosphate N-acetyltransferase
VTIIDSGSDMSDRSCLTIILAAGEGTRMKSARPKVLHEIAGLPMVCHVAKAAMAAGGGDVAVVAGRGAEDVGNALAASGIVAETFIQAERLGTAHAVLAAREAIARGHDDLLIVFGDTPLVEPGALGEARRLLGAGNAVVVMGFRTQDPTGYGRLVERNGRLVAIREDRDCSPQEKAIEFCNGGLMAIDGRRALALLDGIGNANAKGEYYLTDIVEAAVAAGFPVAATEVAQDSLMGVNNRAELAEAEAAWQRRRRRALMLDGVTMTAPETVHLSHDTEIEPDVLIEPQVFFGPGVSIASGATIRGFSHVEGARIAAGAEVGPFARLRPGAELGEKSKVGNFCEVKKAVIEPGAKVNHLTYIGDARIGANANVGAGTITCNYDGYSKFFTDIGAGAFIGSNSALVAPVRIGEGAYVASGSVVTEDVPDGALAIGRARQTTKEGKGSELRERLAAARRKAGK